MDESVLVASRFSMANPWPYSWQKCRNLRPGIFAVCLEEDCRSGKGNTQKSYMRRYLLQTPGVSDGEPASPGSMLRTTRAGLPAATYSGYNELYDPSRPQGPVTAALCWAHARRQFFELADIAANARRGKKAAAISPIALEAVKCIDALFDIERGINGQSAEQRLRVRKEQSAPLVAGLEAWLREQRSRLSRASSVAEPIDYMLRRWGRFARFIDDGRICLTNNAAERALRGFVLGIKSWLFAGSERGADRAAVMATLIVTAKLNDMDPQAWLADVLARMADHTIQNLDQLEAERGQTCRLTDATAVPTRGFLCVQRLHGGNDDKA
jgi:transposase